MSTGIITVSDVLTNCMYSVCFVTHANVSLQAEHNLNGFSFALYHGSLHTMKFISSFAACLTSH